MSGADRDIFFIYSAFQRQRAGIGHICKGNIGTNSQRASIVDGANGTFHTADDDVVFCLGYLDVNRTTLVDIQRINGKSIEIAVCTPTVRGNIKSGAVIDRH